jgi:hypothetical protein
MKKMFFVLVCFLMLMSNSFASEVCGNSYTFFYNEIVYIMKFISSNPELPCSSGSATLYWQTQTAQYNFAINSQKLISISGVGKFFLSQDKLYMLDSTSIIFDEL